MVDAVLVTISVIFAILIIIASLYFVVYFQHPSDENIAIFPKVIVVSALAIACWNVFLIPLDVGNQGTSVDVAGAGGIPVALLTISFYSITIIYSLVIIPFSIFYYEGEDDKDRGDGAKPNPFVAVGYSLKWIMPLWVVFAVIIAVLYLNEDPGFANALVDADMYSSQLFRVSNIPEQWFQFKYFCANSTLAISEANSVVGGAALFATDPSLCGYISPGITNGCCKVSVNNSFKISWIIFGIAIILFLGWFLFAIFCGVGLAALPYDLIQEFINRPKPITATEYAEKKKSLGVQAQILFETGKNLQSDLKDVAKLAVTNRRYRSTRIREANFRKDVMIIEYHYVKLEEAYKYQGGNILWQYVKLVFGVIGILISSSWILHIGLYLLPNVFKLPQPVDIFLNAMLIQAKAAADFFATFLYIIFAFYLFFCVIKGNQKLGFRVFFITIHPLKVGDTMMSGLLFNAGVILSTSLPIGQFCTLSFQDFAALTANNSIFGVQMSRLNNFNYAYATFICLMMACTGFTLFFQALRPQSKRKENQFNYDKV